MNKNKKKLKGKKRKKIETFFKKLKKKISREVKEDLNSKSTFTIWEVITIIFISILFGVVVGYMISLGRNPFAIGKNNSSLNEMIDTYNSILKDYYHGTKKDELAQAGIRGMIESLNDPHSVYMDSDSTKNFNEVIDGSFIGIGVTVMFENNYNRVVEVVKDGPASKAGIKADDIIIEVDSKSAEGVSGDALAKLIRGKKGTKVLITVKRGEKNKKFSVKRDTIEIDSVSNVEFDKDGKKVGYLNISAFANNTSKQFFKNLKELETKKIDSLIIDVRDNPGGHLSQTKIILNKFFDKKTVLYQIENNNSKRKYYATSNEKRTYPIIILVNGGSASASEMLASCFQENYKNALVLGNKTYGKGTVQKSKRLTTGTSIKYTTEKWLTSKGKWLHNNGLEPDVVVDQTDDYYKVPNYENDNQLQEALNLIKDMK